jgi:hypothetical protein
MNAETLNTPASEPSMPARRRRSRSPRIALGHHALTVAFVLVPQMADILFATAVSIRVRPTERSLSDTARTLYSAARRCVREAHCHPADQDRLRNSAAAILGCRRRVMAALEHQREQAARAGTPLAALHEAQPREATPSTSKAGSSAAPEGEA